MKLNDKVRFVNEKLSGIITRIIDDKTVGVEVEDGFEIPVLKSEIVLVSTSIPESPNTPVISPDSLQLRPEGLYIYLEQRFTTFYYQKIYNFFLCAISVNCYRRMGTSWEFLNHQVLSPGSGLLIDNLDFTETGKWPELFIQAALHNNFNNDQLPEPLLYRFQYRTKDYIQSEKNKDGKTLYVVSPEPFKAKVKVEVERVIMPLSTKHADKPIMAVDRPERVVDLHLEKLHSNPMGIKADEALQLQIEAFQNNFEKAMSMNFGKITFIHGVGNGTLKNYIWGFLSKSKDIRTYREAMKEKFGYGATEIIFK